MKILFIIPARGGSKGIPHKNVREFCGKPLIAHSVEQALEFSSPENICVSTDDPAIALAAEKAGAVIPFSRPEHLASDTASSRDVMLHALDFYNKLAAETHHRLYDTIVLLQPTSPLRCYDDIKNTIDAYSLALSSGKNPDMAVSVTEANANPYYDIFETDNRGFLHISKGNGKFTRRQDAPKVWQYNGAVYVINADSLINDNMSDFQNIVPVVMPRDRSVDLDSETDWIIAETLFAKKK